MQVGIFSGFEGDCKLFGRRITKSGWLSLSVLVLAVLVMIFLVCAPLATISVKIDLPPASATPRPPTPSEWLTMFAFTFGGLAAVFLLVGVPIWLVVGTARRIIRAQPKAKP